MKSFVVFVLIVACTVFAFEDPYSSGSSVFQPASLPCKFKLYYTETVVYKDEEPSVTEGQIAMYGKHFSLRTFDGRTEELDVIRADISDPDDPETGSAFSTVRGPSLYYCKLTSYNPVDDLYSGFDYEYRYFAYPFQYESMKTNDEWNGVKCQSYTSFDTFWERNTTIYVNDEQHVIGVAIVDVRTTRTLNVDKIDDNVLVNDFKMLIESGCVDFNGLHVNEKAYENPPEEQSCPYPDEPATFKHNLPCSFKVFFSENETNDYSTYDVNVEGWIAVYGRYVTRYIQSTDDDSESFVVVRPDDPDPDNPKNVGVFMALSSGRYKACLAETYYPLELAYAEMDEVMPFVKPFEYSSMNENDEWNGVPCKSYSNDALLHKYNTTLFVNGKDEIIGMAMINDYDEMYVDIEKTEDTAYNVDFKLPKSYSGCKGGKIFEDPGKESNCKLSYKDESEDSNVSSGSAIIPSLFLLVLAMAFIF